MNDYQGQAYFHKHNRNIKRAEENFKEKQASNRQDNLRKPVPALIFTASGTFIGKMESLKIKDETARVSISRSAACRWLREIRAKA